jgi:hypothetical protein
MTFFLIRINTEKTVTLSKTFMFMITLINNQRSCIHITGCKFINIATIFLLNGLALFSILSFKIDL